MNDNKTTITWLKYLIHKFNIKGDWNQFDTREYLAIEPKSTRSINQKD